MKKNRGFGKKVALPFAIALGIVVAIVTLPPAQEQPVAAANIEVSAAQFAKYLQDWSEPEGFFDSDNFISNETSYQHVVEDLHKRTTSGGVYIGVGPDQNFTYIAHTRPSLAIIVDIRRQNMLEHLLFKALFDQANSRADYLALLFAKEKPAVARTAPLTEILAKVRAAPSSEQMFRNHANAVRSILKEKYRLSLSAEDLDKIEYVYRTFWSENLDLRFSSIGRGNAMNYPTYERLLLETDRSGHIQGYLSSDELFQWLKKFEGENRLIPIVGDFAGRQAFQSVSRFLKESGQQVSTFYTSNVEFYLFGTPSWAGFMKNVHALPVAPDSVFIRAYFSTYGRPHPFNVAGHRSTTVIHSLPSFIQDYDSGRIPSYWEVVDRKK